MTNQTLTIGFNIYEKVPEYNHEEYYYWAEDQEGNMYETHYGSNGDDWYITAYENTKTGNMYMSVDNITHYYKQIGRVPKTYIYNRKLEEFVGETLKKEIIDGKTHYGFEDYDTNTFYVIHD